MEKVAEKFQQFSIENSVLHLDIEKMGTELVN